MNITRKTFAGVLTAAALAACSDTGGPETPARIATTIQVSGVDNASQPGEVLTVQATVLDQHGAGLPNTTLSFTPAANSGTVSVATATTDAQGRAGVIWTLSQQAGPQQLRIATGTLEQVVITNVPIIEPPSFTVTPLNWSMPPGSQVIFRAHGLPANAQVRWLVNGIEGGNAQTGTMTGTGPQATYTAPATAQTVTIMAVSTGAASPAVSVVVGSIAGQPGLAWTEWSPRALEFNQSDSLILTLRVNGYVPSVALDRNTGRVQLTPWEPQTFRYAIARADALIGYVNGTLHNFIGYLEPAGVTSRYNLFANVRDANVPFYTVTSLAEDAQRTDYVLNLRYDGTEVSTKTTAVRRLYQLAGDNFDFVSVIDAVDGYSNRYFQSVRNNVNGIGLGSFDNGAQFGSAARLQGVIVYPMSGLFDGANKGFTHELGHRWINFSRLAALNTGIPHWPASDIARDLMGFSIPGSNVGGEFPYNVVADNAGGFRLECSGTSNVFSDLSLYLMGLIPPAEVSTHYVINNFTPGMACNAALNVTPFTIADVIGANGPRAPAAGEAQRDFTAATIVLSRGRLLSASELAYFSHLAQRAELRTQLIVTEGFSSYLANPWYLATGGRSTMTTKMW